MRVLIPGQESWDNAVTAWYGGDNLTAASWASMMVADQALFLASGGRCRSAAVQVLKQEAMVAEARLASALDRVNRALAARTAAQRAASKANEALRKALDRLNQFPDKKSLGNQSAVEAWRAAQKEVTDAQKAKAAAQKAWEEARAAWAKAQAEYNNYPCNK